MLNILWGMLIGLMVAAPLGPVNIICIQRSLSKGAVSAFVVGLGSAAADSIFGALALFSMALVTDFLDQTGSAFKIIGGLIVLGVGIKIFRTHPHLDQDNDSAADRFKGAAAVFILTIMNPMTILAFLAMFATFGFGGEDINLSGNIGPSLYLILGIFLGCSLWWAILAKGTGYFRDKVDDEHLLLINRASGLIVGLLGSWALISGVIFYL